MLSFATEFVVEPSRSSEEFLAAARDWLLGSPHTQFKLSDLGHFGSNDGFSARKSNELIESIRHTSTSTDSAAVRYTRLDASLEWVSTIVFNREQQRNWVGIRTSCESQSPSTRLPAAKKPVFVRTLLKELGGGPDGELIVQNKPHYLTNTDIELAGLCISGNAGCRLPLVYASASFNGDIFANAESLADSLAGMAHVLVEPNRAFSLRLMTEVDSQNVYGGTVGIYWPDGGGRRSFFLGREYESKSEIERAILDEIQTALTNRRPQARLTWPSVQELVSRRKINALLEQGSSKIEEYVDAFDNEIKAKNATLVDAERDISRLKAELHRYQIQSPMQSGLTLNAPREQDLYPGEILGIVRDVIAESIDRVTPNSRRQHVLTSIAGVNPATSDSDSMRDRLKSMLRDFRSMDAKVRNALEEMGFAISEEGKHYKLIYRGDDRYTFTLPKSGSDHKGGLNAAHDISRLLL